MAKIGTGGFILLSRRAEPPVGLVRLAGRLDDWHRDGTLTDDDHGLNLEPGVTGKLGDCDAGWCRFEIEGYGRGYVRQDALWGAGEP